MANLSNINNILRTGSLGVGINRDPASPFEVSSATKPGIKMFNTAASGKTYQAYSDANGNYIIYDEDADDNRFVINSAGNATFSGSVTGTSANFSGIIYSSGGFRTGSTNSSYNLLTRDSTGNTIFVQAAQSNASQPIAKFSYGSATVNAGTAVLQVSKDNSHFVNCDVGIGTATPSANLNVVGPGDANDPVVAIDVTNSSAFNHGLEIFDANLTDGETVLMAIGKAGSTKNTAIFGYIHDADGGNDNLATIGFWGADNKMTVSAGGNVGIGTGTATPTEGKLMVVGKTALKAAGTGEVALRIQRSSSTGRSQYTLETESGSQIWRCGMTGPGSTDYGFFDGVQNAITIKYRDDILFTPGGNVGIGVTGPTEKLHVDGNIAINDRIIGNSKNYATSQGWLPGAAGTFSTQTGYYGGDFVVNGAVAENSVIWGDSPFGNRALQWQTIGESQSDADGGWNKTINNLPDGNTHGYLSYVYVKRTSSATTGTFYYGCAQVLQLNGTVNGNPYFHVHNIGSLPQDVWCVAIGVIQAYTDNNVFTPSIVGVYRVDTGAKILGGTGYKSQSGVQTTQSHRTYHYYSTNPAATLAFADPGFYVIDGTEPTLNDLLDGSAGSGSSPWTTTGNDIYNNNTGSVGIQNTTPSSHPSNRNTLVVGSGVNSGSGTADAGITIFTAPSVFPNQDYATLTFASNTNSYNSANFEFKYLNRDNNQFADSNPSLVLYKGTDKFIGITEQSNQSFIPRIVLQPNYYNSSVTAGNLDQALVTIPLNSGLNNPGVAISGDSSGNSNPFIGMVSTSSSSQITTKFIRFYHNTTLCGTIQKRYNANEVQYLTTSDYRLKEDLKPFKALDTICKINVYNYKWKDIEGDNINYGVLAHELQELIPEVVAGEKDEVNKKGEEEYQSVDYSKLVPHLIQSIQELKAEIEILKSK